MRLSIPLILSLFLLSSCASMETAWDKTTEVAKDSYEWAVGDDDKGNHKKD